MRCVADILKLLANELKMRLVKVRLICMVLHLVDLRVLLRLCNHFGEDQSISEVCLGYDIKLILELFWVIVRKW